MSDKNIGIIVQARTGSTRLPGKILLPIEAEGKTFFDLLLSRLTAELPHIPIVVATTNQSNDNVIVDHATALDIPSFRGSENDVLDRFTSCAKHYGFDVIIRVCSDNPFLDIGALSNLLANYKKEDYLAYEINAQPSILTHYGFFAEIVSLSALEKVASLGPGCREHVTNCIYGNRDQFNVQFILDFIENENIRCTLDTQSDFNALSYIYTEWYLNKEGTHCPHEEIVQFIENNDHLISGMVDQIIINSK